MSQDVCSWETRSAPSTSGTCGRVLAHVRRQGLGLEEALDLTGEIFAAALMASTRYRPGEAPASAWLFGIARNKLAKYRRGRASEDAARRKLGMSRLSFSDDARERVEDLLDAAPPVYSNGIGDLPPAEREAVLARIVEERHYADGEVESIRVVGEAAGANVRMTKPWTPRTEGGEALRFFVVVDERDIDVGDDGVQIDEIDLISTPIPTIEVTYADGRTEKIEAP